MSDNERIMRREIQDKLSVVARIATLERQVEVLRQMILELQRGLNKQKERLSVIEKAIDRIEILLDAYGDKVISDAGLKTEYTGDNKCSVCGNWMRSIRQDVRFTCGHE